MTITAGFFNSVSGDRVYSALEFGELFDGVIEDGIFATIEDSLMVTANGGMNVAVGAGRAWFNSTWTKIDAPENILVPTASAVNPRIDVVYLEINESSGIRFNSVGILQGTPASTPIVPTLTNTALVHQYPLAEILVGKSVTTILQSAITNKVGLTETPFVTGPLGGVSVSSLLAQWEAQWDEWFEAIQGQLSSAAETNLQNQIYAIVGDVNPPTTTILALKTHDHSSGVGNKITDTGVGAKLLKIPKRVGGHATNWNVSGTTAYTPLTPVVISAGVTQWTGAAASSGSVAVSYGEGGNPFTGEHIVLISCNSYGIEGVTQNFQTNGFTIAWYSNVGPRSNLTFQWIAIGV